MEGLLTQVGSTPVHPERPLPAVPAPHKHNHQTTPSSSSASRRRSTSSATGHNQNQQDAPAYLVDPSVKQDPAEPDHFGSLAPDHNGHLRWIGGSSAMTLVDAFRNISNRSARPHSRPHRADSSTKTAAHNLYFPPVLRFDVRALPGPEQAEFPPRDLADKLVRLPHLHIEV